MKFCQIDSQNTEDSDYSVSSDESDTDSTEHDVSDSENENDTDINVDLNQFFEDHIESTRKFVISNTNRNTEKKIQFEEKMYRVIPVKLDETIFKFENLATTNRK